MESKEEKNVEQIENKDNTNSNVVDEENQENDSSDENNDRQVFVPSTVKFFKSRYAKEQGAQTDEVHQEDEMDARSLAHLFQTYHQTNHQKTEQEEKHHHPHFDHHKAMAVKEEPILGESDEAKLLRLVRIQDEGDLYSMKGSSVDRGLMIDVFSKLQFEVRVYQNLTTGEILDTLERTRFEDHRHSDMLAVIVLSHGNEGIVYGYDKPYPTSRLWENFTADMCEDLAGKPKMFFIQACQGSNLDHGVEVKIDETDSPSGGRTQTDGFASYRTPLHSDFLIAHSTVNGFYSWRNTVQGSWFIQVLGASLLVNAYKYDLLTILTKVSRVIAREYESSSSYKEYNQKKQIPFIYSTLTNKVMLKHK